MTGTPWWDKGPAHARPALRRYPIRRIGPGASRDYVRLPNTLIRDMVPVLGADAVLILAYLLSHEDGWETSNSEMSKALALGTSGVRAKNAIDKLTADRRVVVR